MFSVCVCVCLSVSGQRLMSKEKLSGMIQNYVSEGAMGRRFYNLLESSRTLSHNDHMIRVKGKRIQNVLEHSIVYVRRYD